MLIDIVSVFPEYFDVLGLSLFGKAQEKGLITVRTHNLRQWTHDVHQSVDDTPVGGGAGMVMKPEVWAECLDELLGFEPVDYSDYTKVSASCQRMGVTDTTSSHASTQIAKTTSTQSQSDELVTLADENEVDSQTENTVAELQNPAVPHEHTPIIILPNPSAPLFTQRDAQELSHSQHLIFGCGRYEGYDARIPQYYRAQGVQVREYSIGDYVLNGGEVAVSVMLEAITRLIPGFMGNPESIVEESYTGTNALLEHRQYTKPATWRAIAVPEVLLSGNHALVNRFRRDEAISKTNEIRPDLIEKLDCHQLDKADRKLLISLGWEVSGDHPRKLA